mgnify:CR=1 FL=1
MKKISQIETGGRFLYGGVEWVKLYAGDGTVAISAEPVFERAFDEDNKNDWRSSSLRRELNGAFLDALVAEGADRAAFLDWESDLTADDGMTDYGTATDKIALLSDKLYRMEESTEHEQQGGNSLLAYVRAGRPCVSCVRPRRGPDGKDRFGQRRLPGGKPVEQVLADRPRYACGRNDCASRSRAGKLPEQ